MPPGIGWSGRQVEMSRLNALALTADELSVFLTNLGSLGFVPISTFSSVGSTSHLVCPSLYARPCGCVGVFPFGVDTGNRGWQNSKKSWTFCLTEIWQDLRKGEKMECPVKIEFQVNSKPNWDIWVAQLVKPPSLDFGLS